MGSPETCPTCGMAPRAGRHANFAYCDDPCHATPPAPADDVRRCEGCAAPAVTTDPEDVPLCRECAKTCDEPTPADDAGARVDEAHRALGKPGRVDDDGCCTGCGRSVQPSPCCPDYPVWPGPCRSCYAYDEEQQAVLEAARALCDRLAGTYAAAEPEYKALLAALRGAKGGA